MSNNRYRLRFNFWLNLNDRADEEAADYIELLKNERSFTETIRDGLRLIRDLREGKITVLCELFPFIKEKLATSSSSTDESLRREIEALKVLMLSSANPPTVAPLSISRSVTPLAAGPKPLSAPSFELPRFDDDDDDTLILTKDTRTDSALNFLNSMLALQQ